MSPQSWLSELGRRLATRAKADDAWRESQHLERTRSIAAVIVGHLERALEARLPVIDRVIQLTEAEVFEAANLVESINKKSRQAQDDLVALADCIHATKDPAGGPTLGSAIADQIAAHREFTKLCETTEAKLNHQQRLAKQSVAAVERIISLLGTLADITQKSRTTTSHADLESARIGAADGTLAVISLESCDMTNAMQSLNVAVSEISHELLKTIPLMVQEVTDMRDSQLKALASLSHSLANVSKNQERALTLVNETLHRGRERTADVVAHSYEVMSHLQFQDRIAQELSALKNHERASNQLVLEALLPAEANATDPLELEEAARSIEIIQHGKTANGPSSADELVSIQAGELELF